MKLEAFKPTRKLTKGQPSLSILKNGCFHFSRASCEKLPFIQIKGKIGFSYDKERCSDWYINPSVEGYPIARGKKSNTGDYFYSLQFQSMSLRKEIMNCLEISDDKPIRFRISVEPTEYNGNMYHALIQMK